MKKFEHTTVLLEETVDGLDVKPTGTYVDCTLGGGGHSQLILTKLKQSGHLYSFDQDQTAIDYNQEHLAQYIEKSQLTFVKSNFRNLKDQLNQLGVNGVDGVLYDLGVSSPQFDDADRGFSYRYDAPLDMRMDQSQSMTARDVVNDWDYNDLVRIFFRYGEEKFSKQVARKIENTRQDHVIETTGELVDIIKSAIPAAARRNGGHPAKKVFQAIRIAVNDELGALEESLEQALDLLNQKGRISVITFQSLEDRLVKRMFKEKTEIGDLPAGLPVIPEDRKPKFKLINRKPILPNDIELNENRRSHSAKLRIIEKL